MPIQLTNHGLVPLVLTPYLPICQLIISRTTNESEQQYGKDPNANHKYMNDDGGPSRYWLDARLKKLQEACGNSPVHERIREDFNKIIKSRDKAVVDRFLTHLHDLKAEDATSSREVLENFADLDTRRTEIKKILIRLAKWVPLIPITPSVGAMFKSPYEGLHFALWTLTAVLLPFGIWGQLFSQEPPAPFTRKEVDEYFSVKP